MATPREFRITVKSLVLSDGLPAGTIEVTEVLPESKPANLGDKRFAADNAGEAMTEPQRRYLFRLLAAQGVEGKAAEDHLKDYFHVKALKDVGRQQASQYIDQLVRDQKDVDGARP
jgi:hypothetical protein